MLEITGAELFDLWAWYESLKPRERKLAERFAPETQFKLEGHSGWLLPISFKTKGLKWASVTFAYTKPLVSAFTLTGECTSEPPLPHGDGDLIEIVDKTGRFKALTKVELQ